MSESYGVHRSLRDVHRQFCVPEIHDPACTALRTALADAWDEGYVAACDDGGDPMEQKTLNPYDFGVTPEVLVTSHVHQWRSYGDAKHWEFCIVPGCGEERRVDSDA